MSALHLSRFEDIQAFYDCVSPYLLDHEAEHNVILGLRQNILSGAYDAPPYACYVEDGARVVAVALRTPPHPVNLSLVTEMAALRLIAEDLHTRFENLPAVIGVPEVAQAFAKIWSELSGQTHALTFAEGVYRLMKVIAPAGVAGELRDATEADIETVVDWLIAFQQEALNGKLARTDAERMARFRIPSRPERGMRLWCDAGRVVSMAGYTGPTPHGIRINAVYTPPELRGHGYASACVAALSQELLNAGFRFCFLFTDLANPTSNSIYQKIGYERVSDAHVYSFT